MNFLNGNFLRSRRFRYGSLSVVITALVIAAVILVNVIVTSLSNKYNWPTDMTQEGLYSLSDACYDLLDETFEKVSADRAEKGEPEVKVVIKFCDALDDLMSGTYSRYVAETALELAAHYPDIISVEYLDIYENPTSVNPYKVSVNTTITTSNVIVVSGGEYRLYNLSSFFLSSGSTPWAYYGEKRFASAILAVTQAEKPIAGILVGHGEFGGSTSISEYALVDLLEFAGYQIDIIDDLPSYEFPDNCRLLVCYNPTADFRSTDDGISDVSEIQILEDFMTGNNHSLMVFMAPESPRLTYFENFLATWGIQYCRTDTGSCVIREPGSAALTSNGTTFIGQYETLGTGASITSDMRKAVVPQKVVFRNAMPITISDTYSDNHSIVEDEDSGEMTRYHYGSLVMGPYSREVWRIFSTTPEAMALENGHLSDYDNKDDTYGLMTLSIQRRLNQDDNYGASYADNSSYVLACGSTEFCDKNVLDNNVYGNSEALMKALVSMGKEAVPVTLTFIPFADLTIDTLPAQRANRITGWLTVAPVVVVSAIGLWVLIRRKFL